MVPHAPAKQGFFHVCQMMNASPCDEKRRVAASDFAAAVGQGSREAAAAAQARMSGYTGRRRPSSHA